MQISPRPQPPLAHIVPLRTFLQSQAYTLNPVYRQAFFTLFPNEKAKR